MNFPSDLVDLIAANSSLVVDTDLFLGEEPPEAPTRLVLVRESAGGYQTESGMILCPIQVLAKDLDYMNARSLSFVVYDLLVNKPGFQTVEGIFFCEIINRPFAVDRDPRGCYIFSSNYLFRGI